MCRFRNTKISSSRVTPYILYEYEYDDDANTYIFTDGSRRNRAPINLRDPLRLIARVPITRVLRNTRILIRIYISVLN